MLVVARWNCEKWLEVYRGLDAHDWCINHGIKDCAVFTLSEWVRM